MRSTWTRRVAAPIAAVAAGALLVAGGGQAAASSGTLSVSAARHLAHKLEAKQRKERSLVFTELGKPHRRSSTRIDFPYRDRSTSDVLCTATIVVVQNGSKRAADLRDAACHGIPSEILGFERATRAVKHAVTDAAPDVRKSFDRYDKSLSQCDTVVVPKNRRDDVDLLVKAGGVAAFYLPLRATLDDYDTALHDVHGHDPSMLRGVDAWDKVLVLRDELPPAAAHACRAVRDWAANGFSDDTAPANFDELRVVLHQFRVQSSKLDKTARYLAKQGAVAKVAAVFAPAGMLARVDPNRSL
jgi:hypothetical protein